MKTSAICSGCGKVHSVADMELGFDLPDVVHALSDEELERRCRYSRDACVLDEKHFYIRAVLPIPVRGRTVPYNIGAWAEISKAAFSRVYELWIDPNQTSEPRFRGTIANTIPLLPQTLGVEVAVQLTGPKSCPALFVAANGHPLFLEQAEGILEHRALEYSDESTMGSA